jgi:hypothetical protein
VERIAVAGVALEVLLSHPRNDYAHVFDGVSE